MMRAFLIFFLTMASLPFSAHGQEAGKKPVVIEMFGSSMCSGDFPVQEQAKEIVESNAEAILVNCRMKVLDTPEQQDPFSLGSCDEKRRGYFGRMKLFTPKNPHIIVDGRYEANNNNVAAAYKAARSIDDIKTIEIKAGDEMLEITIPEVESGARTGEIYLYAYTTSRYGLFSLTTPEKAVRAEEPEMPIVPDDGQGVLISAGTTLLPIHYKPVVAMKRIGQWDGVPMSFSYSIRDFSPLIEDENRSFGYIVLLHEKDAYGPLLAAGELKAEERGVPLSELENTLPKSSPSANRQDQP